MTEAEPRSCAHRTCTCNVPTPGDFCSGYCRNTLSGDEAGPGDEADHEADAAACACGHDACSSDTQRSARNDGPDDRSEDEVTIAMGGGPGEHLPPPKAS